MRAIVFRVNGIPPTKDSGKSLWNQIEKVKELARASKIAMEGQEIFKSRIELIVRLFTKRDKKTGDATNFIGGIADVLQGWGCSITKPKDKPTDMEIRKNYKGHIVYENDNQIIKLSYVEYPLLEGECPHYFVMVVEIGGTKFNDRRKK